MKKSILWVAGICIMSLVLLVGIARYSVNQKRQSDPNWQIAQEIYKKENALKEVDEDFACQTVAKVTPFTYTDFEGNTIVYYCVQTAYLQNGSGNNSRVDVNAISLVVDPEQIETRGNAR